MSKKGEKRSPHLNSDTTRHIQTTVATTNSGLKRSYLPLIFSGVLFIFYWFVSAASEGFYQHDEVGHYLQIINFWNQPMVYLLDMWARGGYKLLYALPGLLGKEAVVMTNILFSVASCYLAYLIASYYKLQFPWLAFLFTALQPFVINLSFRCYSEIPSMFFMTWLVYVFLKDRYKTAALLASFLFTLRQEMAVFAIIAGFFFLYKREWLSFLLLGTAPLILNILGWIQHQDPLYVWHMMTQGGLQDTYARNGFFYLWLMLPEISGIIIFYLFMIPGIAFWASPEKIRLLKKYGVLIVAFCVYFLMHCVFTSKSFGFGRSGGLGRFLMVVLPLVGVISLIGFNYLMSEAKAIHKSLVGASSFVILLIFFLYLEDLQPLVFNGYITVGNASQNLNALILVVICCGILIFFPRSGNYLVYAIMGILLIYSTAAIQKIELNAEDVNMRDASSWVLSNEPDVKKIYSDHIMFEYFYVDGGGSKSRITGYDSTTLTLAKPGEIFIFENHYGIKQVSPEKFNTPDYQLLREFADPGTNIRSFVLKKVK